MNGKILITVNSDQKKTEGEISFSSDFELNETLEFLRLLVAFLANASAPISEHLS